MYARWLVGRGGYVVELIRADDLDVVKWQQFLDDAARLELRPILRLATWQDRAAGHWVAPPTDKDGQGYREIAERWARFLGALRFDGTLYVVVGNETNRGDEWGGNPNPAEYARYLLDVSDALRQLKSNNLKILNGALDQYAPDTGGEAVNGFRAIDAASYLEGMQAADPRVWDAIDIWAAHAYPLGPFSAHPGRQQFQVDDALAGGPRTRQPPFPGLVNRGVNSYRWELFQLAGLGMKRPLRVFVTETGWRHRESQTPSGDQHGAVIGGEQAAEYIRLAFDGDPLLDPREQSWTPWADDRDVGAVVLFALGGEPSRWGHTNLLVLGENGAVLGLKPQFAGLIKRP